MFVLINKCNKRKTYDNKNPNPENFQMTWETN